VIDAALRLILSFFFAILTIIASLTWLWPATRRWMGSNTEGEAAALAVGIGSSAGVLSLYMLALGLLPGRLLQPALVLPLPWFGLGYEAWREWQLHSSLRHIPRALLALLPNSKMARWLLLVCAAGLLVIIINTFSYPFYRYDVLARFAPNARLLFDTNTISESLIGYPLEVQLLYSFAFMASGQVNDHLAGLFVAAFALATVLVTYAIGRTLFSKSAGWASAILLLSAPLFVDWATSGYVDVPSGLYHGLTFLLAWYWLVRGEMKWAFGAGLMAGLALWTKQSAAVLLPALAIVPLLRGWPMRAFLRETIFGLGALGGALLVAGPWYLRNYLTSGVNGIIIVPGSFDTHRVVRSLQSLITFIGDIGQWGPWLSLTALLGIILWAASVVWPAVENVSPRSINRRQRAVLLAAFVLPYHLLWWWSFRSTVSDTRYLLISIPFYAAVAGLAVAWGLSKFPALMRLPRWPVIAGAAALILFGSFGRMGAVYHLVRNPFQSDDTKLNRLSPELWQLTSYIRENISLGAHLFVMDGALAYWLSDYSLEQGFPTELSQLAHADYFVSAPFGDSVYAFWGQSENEVGQALDDPDILPAVYEHSGGAAIYQVINEQQ